MHEHVRPVAIAEFLLGLDLPRLVLVLGVGVCGGDVSVGGGVGDALPAAGLVHVGAVLGDGVRAALSLGGVETLRCLAGLTGGGQVQAVHPAVS